VGETLTFPKRRRPPSTPAMELIVCSWAWPNTASAIRRRVPRHALDRFSHCGEPTPPIWVVLVNHPSGSFCLLHHHHHSPQHRTTTTATTTTTTAAAHRLARILIPAGPRCRQGLRTTDPCRLPRRKSGC
jgi:hypothetical protein